MTYKNIALAGATGSLSPSILSALLSAGFNVTVLSRSSSPNLPSGVDHIQVDYTSHSSLVSALKNQDVLVSNIPNHGDQPTLIDAAISAGVKRFIPSEFGSNIWGNDKTRALPVFAGKAKTQEYLKTKESEIAYTIIINGLFLDWGLEKGFLINTKGVTNVYDGGDGVRSTTLLSDVGKTVVGVLEHPEETKNRAVYVQSAAIPQNLLLRLAKKVDPDFKAETRDLDTEAVERESYEELKKENPNYGKAFIDQVKVSVFRDGYGSYWGEGNDDELFGIQNLSESQLEELIKKIS